MADLERPERLQIMLSVEELTALEDWRFEQRMPSRAAAVRELLRRGLMAEGMLNGQGAKSQDFGVLSDPAKNGEDEDLSPAEAPSQHEPEGGDGSLRFGECAAVAAAATAFNVI